MKSSSTSKDNHSSGDEQPHANPPALAILRCEDHRNLAGVLTRVRSVSPLLLPAALPRNVVIKPNLCDVVSWEAAVTTAPSWLPVLAAELRAIRTDLQIVVV